MIRVPAEIAADLADAVNAECAARTALRNAVRRQSDLMRRLREGGVRLTDAVIPVARALGEAATPAFRRRLAARLRKRAEREDSRPRDLPGASPRDDSALLRVEQRKEATAMAEKTKLVRRTITEEVYASPDVDPEIDADEDDEVEDESDEDDEPSRKKRR